MGRMLPGDDNQCVFASFCRLESALARATQAFLAVLDAVTLDQLVVGGMMAIPRQRRRVPFRSSRFPR